MEEKAILNEEEDNSDVIIPEIDQDITEEEASNNIVDDASDIEEESPEIFEDIETLENTEEIITEDATIEEAIVELLKDIDDLSDNPDDGEVKGETDADLENTEDEETDTDIEDIEDEETESEPAKEEPTEEVPIDITIQQ